MANNSERWYFTKEKIRNSPSVQDGIEQAKELGYRQQCANLIQDIGQRLHVYITFIFAIFNSFIFPGAGPLFVIDCHYFAYVKELIR